MADQPKTSKTLDALSILVEGMPENLRGSLVASLIDILNLIRKYAGQNSNPDRLTKKIAALANAAARVAALVDTPQRIAQIAINTIDTADENGAEAITKFDAIFGRDNYIEVVNAITPLVTGLTNAFNVAEAASRAIKDIEQLAIETKATLTSLPEAVFAFDWGELETLAVELLEALLFGPTEQAIRGEAEPKPDFSVILKQASPLTT